MGGWGAVQRGPSIRAYIYTDRKEKGTSQGGLQDEGGFLGIGCCCGPEAHRQGGVTMGFCGPSPPVSMVMGSKAMGRGQHGRSSKKWAVQM